MTRSVRLSLSRRRLLHGTAAAGAVASLTTRSLLALAQSPTEDPATPVVQRTDDVVYGEVEGAPLLLDIQQPPAREDPRPAVVVLHGGGLVEGSRANAVVPATKLAEAGYVTFNIAYRLFRTDVQNPDARINPWPTQLDDVQRAVRWVRANAATYGVDPERVGAYGHSTGGQLAALLGVRETRDDSDPALAGISSRVACVVDLAGDVDQTSLSRDQLDNEMTAAVLGGTREEVPGAYRDASPLDQVDAESAPFLVIHGANDEVIPVESSRRLVEALHEAGVEVTYLELPDADHSDAGSWPTSGPWVLTFFGVHLDPEH